VNKLVALAFVPIDDVAKAYSSIVIDFDQESDGLLEYFEKTWVGQKRMRGKYKHIVCFYHFAIIVWF
jgi:hypothetical protein